MMSLRDILYGTRQYMQDGIKVVDSKFDSFTSFLQLEDQRDDGSNAEPVNGETETDYTTTTILEQDSRHSSGPKYNCISSTSSHDDVSGSKETSFLNVIIKQPQNVSERKVSTDGDLNVFISDRHMSLNEAILQGEAYFGPQHLEINIHETPSVKENGVHLNISVPERKLSFTQVIPINDRKFSNSSSTLLEAFLDVQTNSQEEEVDDLDEMNMPNPGNEMILGLLLIFTIFY